MAEKHVVVTGASAGIGLALCKLLATEHNCYVYLGSRNAEKGEASKKSIVDDFPDAASKIEVLPLDVTKQDSINAAAEALKKKNVKLYALVNNAGIGLGTGVAGDFDSVTTNIMETNVYGVKRVTETFVNLVDEKEGRIVNVSSGAASMWLRNQDGETKKLFSQPESWEQIEAALKANIASGNVGFGEGYGLSKTTLTALTIIQSRQYPKLKVTSLSPGFIKTAMAAQFGAKLTPEEGCVSSIKCLFGDVTSGFYYGSDGLRSPLTVALPRSFAAAQPWLRSSHQSA